MAGSQLLGLRLYEDIATHKGISSLAAFSQTHNYDADHYDHPSISSFESHTRVEASPGKGSGLFVTKEIPAYSLILSDYALLGLFGQENLLELLSKYEALPAEHREEFDSLSRSRSTERDASLAVKLRTRGYGEDKVARMVEVSQTFLANAFNISDADIVADLKLHPDRSPLRRAIFAQLARVNHSCIPNAHVHYQPSSKSQLLYSIRDLYPGEEIVISYFDITLPRSMRQERARAWGFSCSCSGCSGQGVVPHEERLAAIRDAITRGTQAIHPRKPRNGDSVKVVLQKVLDSIKVAGQTDGLQPILPLLYDLAGDLRLESHDQKGMVSVRSALEDYRKASQWEINLTGEYSLSAFKRAVKLQCHEAS